MKLKRTTTSGVAIFSIFASLLTFSCKKSSSPAPTGGPLQISAIYPQEAPGGATVTIRGAGFSDTPSADSVYFNGMLAAVSFAEDSILQVTVPMTAGTGNVSVKVKGTTATGPSFTYDYQGNVTTFAGTAGPGGAKNGTGSNASFQNPWNIAVDGNGNLYVADYSNKMIRMITPGHVVSTLITLPNYPAGVALDGNGSLYVSLNAPSPGIFKLDLATASGTIISGESTPGFANSGNGLFAQFTEPNGLAVDKNGNVYVADEGNQLIRMVNPQSTPQGATTTFAGLLHNGGAINGAGNIATFNFPAGLAFDAVGNLFVADYGNNMIRKITPDTTVSTVAGSGYFGFADGMGAAAGFNGPMAIAVDSKGNLYVADDNNNVIRMITPAGAVTTIAGSGNEGSTDGIGAAASFSYPCGIACDANGTLWVVDGGNNTIRKITLQ